MKFLLLYGFLKFFICFLYYFKNFHHCCRLSVRYFMLSQRILKITDILQLYFLPRCMECRRGLAMRILSSVRPSVRPSNA